VLPSIDPIYSGVASPRPEWSCNIPSAKFSSTFSSTFYGPNLCCVPLCDAFATYRRVTHLHNGAFLRQKRALA
jgi:hypothetical protein